MRAKSESVLGKLRCAAIAVLVAGAWACDEAEQAAIGQHTERFLAVLRPAARDCIMSAVPEAKLESVLGELAKLPAHDAELPPTLKQLTACTEEAELREGVARVVLAALPRQRSRLMLAQEDTPDDEVEVRRRLAAFPRRLQQDRYRFQGFERRGPETLSVVYQRADPPEPAQSLSVDLLAYPGRHPEGWTAGELVVAAALEAGDQLIAAGVHHGVAWARFVVPSEGGEMQVITWGDVDGRALFRAEGASRDVLLALLRAFRAGA